VLTLQLAGRALTEDHDHPEVEATPVRSETFINPERTGGSCSGDYDFLVTGTDLTGIANTLRCHITMSDQMLDAIRFRSQEGALS
jgi:hypothetical protein